MSKAMELAWEAIHVQEIDLDILEGDIAAADVECEAVKAQPHRADIFDLALAAARLRAAEVAYQQALASPSPRPTPTPTKTATPTATATPTRTPTATATPGPPFEDVSRIYSKVSGRVVAVRLAAISGNEVTIEIDVYPD